MSPFSLSEEADEILLTIFSPAIPIPEKSQTLSGPASPGMIKGILTYEFESPGVGELFIKVSETCENEMNVKKMESISRVIRFIRSIFNKGTILFLCLTGCNVKIWLNCDLVSSSPDISLIEKISEIDRGKFKTGRSRKGIKAFRVK